MITMNDLVWYASYGSNLLYDRFLCYILGGKPEGSSANCPGCSDRSLPQDDRPITIHHRLYFSRKSLSWEGKGVAFIRSGRDDDVRTLGRMYLITRDQFTQVVRQENGRASDYSQISIDFNRTISSGQSLINGGWYSRIIYLGTEDGYPIFTFTGGWDDDDIQPNEPGEAYRGTIIRGLKETYPEMSDEEISSYIRMAAGYIDDP